MKKLISARHEEQVDKLFQNFEIFNQNKYIVISLVDFILSILETSSYVKFIQMNTETFFFVFETIVDKYLQQGEDKSLAPAKKSIFKKLYKKMKILFEQEFSNFSEANILNNSIDSVISKNPQKIILLEFDIKSAKSYSDIINIKYYHSFVEKVNETLTNEKLFIPIINGREDMINIQSFTENLINYCSYINDFSFLDRNNNLPVHLFKKYNAKNALENRVILFNEFSSKNKILGKLSENLILLLLITEYTDKNCLDKIKYINNDIQQITDHFQNNFNRNDNNRWTFPQRIFKTRGIT